MGKAWHEGIPGQATRTSDSATYQDIPSGTAENQKEKQTEQPPLSFLYKVSRRTLPPFLPKQGILQFIYIHYYINVHIYRRHFMSTNLKNHLNCLQDPFLVIHSFGSILKRYL